MLQMFLPPVRCCYQWQDLALFERIAIQADWAVRYAQHTPLQLASYADGTPVEPSATSGSVKITKARWDAKSEMCVAFMDAPMVRRMPVVGDCPEEWRAEGTNNGDPGLCWEETFSCDLLGYTYNKGSALCEDLNYFHLLASPECDEDFELRRTIDGEAFCLSKIEYQVNDDGKCKDIETLHNGKCRSEEFRTPKWTKKCSEKWVGVQFGEGEKEGQLCYRLKSRPPVENLIGHPNPGIKCPEGFILQGGALNLVGNFRLDRLFCAPQIPLPWLADCSHATLSELGTHEETGELVCRIKSEYADVGESYPSRRQAQYDSGALGEFISNWSPLPFPA